MSKDIFKSNPNLPEAFVTSDGESFYSKNAAENHAKTLKDKTFKHVVNPTEKVALVEGNEQNFVQTGENTDGSPKTEAKLTPKQQAQADYTKKFDEIPADEFTKNQLLEAIESGVKLVAELNND